MTHRPHLPRPQHTHRWKHRGAAGPLTSDPSLPSTRSSVRRAGVDTQGIGQGAPAPPDPEDNPRAGAPPCGAPSLPQAEPETTEREAAGWDQGPVGPEGAQSPSSFPPEKDKPSLRRNGGLEGEAWSTHGAVQARTAAGIPGTLGPGAERSV